MAKILLVEDDKSLREIYGVRLLAEGYDIVSAGDGEEALAMAIKERPDLIVSDVMMPKISGFDMLDILRSTTETKGIKVIMMTALSSEDQRQRGEQLGADRYLVKSQVGIEDVVRTVHEVLGDAPIASQPNAFAAPAPSAIPRPAPTAVTERSAPASASPQPTPAVAPEPPEPPTKAPVSLTVPEDSSSSPAPAAVANPLPPSPSDSTPASALPQPTAPFSTARPAGLADRVIHPIERAEEFGEPIGSLMDKELGASQPPMPEPSVQTAPVIPEPALPPQPPQMPVPPAPDATASPVQDENHGISFEETPRPTN